MSQEQPFDSAGEFHRAVLGQNGFRYLVVGDSETAADEEYCALQALTEAAVTATVEPGDSDGDTSIDLTIPAGVVIYGAFTAVDLTSGTLIAYFANDGK